MTTRTDTAFRKGVRSFSDGLRSLADDRFTEFQEKYFYDPVGFARDCIEWPDGESVTPYQAETMEALLREKRVAVRSLHGAGKTGMAAIIVLWYCLTREGKDWKVITTASVWRQLTEFLWPEIHKWARRIKWHVIGRDPFDERAELLTQHLILRTGRAVAIASNKPTAIEGAHADYILYLFDEAKAIPDGIFDAAEGAFSGGSTETLALAISTPGEPQGRFYDIHKRRDGFEDWWTRHWTVIEALAAGRTTEDWIEKRKRQWGETDPRFMNRVMGEFADNDPRGVIPLSWYERAVERWYEWMESGGVALDSLPPKTLHDAIYDAWLMAGGPDATNATLTTVGVDVGSGSPEGDRSVLAVAYDGYHVGRLEFVPQGDPALATIETAHTCAKYLDRHKGAEGIIDVIGIGAGVGAELRRYGFRSRFFWAGKPTELTDKTGEVGFANWRSAAWWILREMLEPNSGFNVMLPPDDTLEEDLISPHWGYNNAGEVQIEKKESIYKRIHRSTDAGDAVIMAIVGPMLCDEEMMGNMNRVTYDPPDIGEFDGG
jgi:hypothetical protein